jgi:hypothetical protein
MTSETMSICFCEKNCMFFSTKNTRVTPQKIHSTQSQSLFPRAINVYQSTPALPSPKLPIRKLDATGITPGSKSGSESDSTSGSTLGNGVARSGILVGEAGKVVSALAGLFS